MHLLTGLYIQIFCEVNGKLLFSAKTPSNGQVAGYIDSGSWSADAIRHAEYYGKVEVLSSSKTDNYQHLPEWPQSIPAHLAYLHVTTNNTIYGTQWRDLPNIDVPLVADMSSDIFSKNINYTNCSMFYAVLAKKHI